MKNLIILILALFLVGCAADSKDSGGGDEESPITPPTTSNSEVKSISLSGVDNLVLASSQSQQSTTASTTASPVAYTVKDGKLEQIEIEGGEGKTVVAAYPVKGSTKKAVKFQDQDGAITTCIVGSDNLCSELSIDPQKTSNLGNADFLIEAGGKIYFRTQDKKLKSISASSAQSMYQPMEVEEEAGNVEQVAIHQNGEMIIDSGANVDYIANDSTNDLGDVRYNDEDRGIPFYPLVTDTHFFLASGNGFLVKRGSNYNDFLRFYTVDGNATPRLAQQNAFYQYLDGVNGVYTRISTLKNPDSCYTHSMTDSELLVCPPHIYAIGDASNDFASFDYTYANHLIFGHLLSVTDDYIYIYSENENGTPRKLTRETLFGSVSTRLFPSIDTIPETIAYSISKLIASTTQDGDIVRFCGIRQSDDVPVIGEITHADTTPAIAIVESGCDDLVAF